MDIGFPRAICSDLATAERREWLCANGIGGFAMGTVAGLATRRYHALLVAALAPPLGRTVLVHRLEETVGYDGERTPLFADRWASGAVEPRGFERIERFRVDVTTPAWTYAVADALLEKRILLVPGENSACVSYRLLRAAGPIDLEIKVIAGCRDYHHLARAGGAPTVEAVDGGLRIAVHRGATAITVRCDRPCAFAPAADWHRGVLYAAERERGLDDSEDCLHAATLRLRLEPGAEAAVICSAEDAPPSDGAAARAKRDAHDASVVARWRRATAGLATPAWMDRLALAADAFVAQRSRPGGGSGATVIAGYPWFGDWGRDTCIALPGLLLATGRHEQAREVLLTWAAHRDRGMLPNLFADDGGGAEYNTVDAALWFVEAVRAWQEVDGDATTLRELLPAVEDVCRFYAAGTRHGIRADPADGLLRCGEPGVQPTWMDARVGGREITPRHGKPVEVNALWINALAAAAQLAGAAGRPAGVWAAMAARARIGFRRFWNADAGCCFDVLDGPDGHDASVRPNQIIAASLSACALDDDRAAAVVAVCARRLWTPGGLRTLDPTHRAYAGRYAGGPGERDAVYHQGPAWPWLLGHFALAHLRVHRDPDAAMAWLEPLAARVLDDGVGQLAELHDGDPPHAPRGCPAQAWSVAELLRAGLALLRARRAA